MIHRLIKFGLIFFIIIISFTGCIQKPSQWYEYADQFYTCDKYRAQKELPFTVIFPHYLPNIEENMRLNRIEGTLKEYQHEAKAWVTIYYCTKQVDGPFITIEEYNYPVTLANPNINPKLSINEYKARDLVISDRNEDLYFYYNYEGIYFHIHFEYIPFEEAAKVVESMLKQL